MFNVWVIISLQFFVQFNTGYCIAYGNQNEAVELDASRIRTRSVYTLHGRVAPARGRDDMYRISYFQFDMFL